MKNWNRTGKIKAIILALSALPNLVAPIGAVGQLELAMILMPLIFATIAIPVITKLNAAFGAEAVKPIWNDDPLTLKRPLSMFHFFAYFFLIVGLSMEIGTALKYHTLSTIGLTSIAFGLGIFSGIRLSLKWTGMNA